MCWCAYDAGGAYGAGGAYDADGAYGAGDAYGAGGAMVPVVPQNMYFRTQFDKVNLTTKFVTSGGFILVFLKSNLVLIL